MKNQKSKNEMFAVFLMILSITILLVSGSFLTLEGIKVYLNGETLLGWFYLTLGIVAFIYMAIYLVSLLHKD